MRSLPLAAPRWFGLGCCGLALLCAVPLARAAENAAARLTLVRKEVTLVAPEGGSRPARPNESIAAGSRLRTGGSGEAEITLPGVGLVRLGDKTELRLAQNGRELQLEEGLVLFQSARGSRKTKLQSGALNLDFRGSTGLIERNGNSYLKILILEGEARVYTRRLGESIVLGPGQLLITNPTADRLPEAVHFNIEQLYKTSVLTNAAFAPLPSRALIERAIAQQKRDPSFVPTNLVIFGRGTLVNLIPPRPSPSPAKVSSQANKKNP